jgi:conjugative relaxase-like TrwC/TraI family protein
MLTIRRLSLGKGYKYLMDSIAGGDGAAQQSSALTRYYAESGTPPGIFLGSGLAALGGGEGVEPGSQVSEEHLYRMLGLCADPLDGTLLGHPVRAVQVSVSERIDKRMARLPDHLSEEGRAARRAEITADEERKALRRTPPVAGFDLTFSPSKSVSVAWALADQGTKAVIYACHRRAIDYTLTYAEDHVFHSRSGRDGVVQEDVEGITAAAFTHYDSRSGDPQLHDHVVVWNRAKSLSDGQWRTLDSRGLYKQVVTLSELYDGVLSDLLTDALDIGWDGKTTRNGMVKHEMTGIPEALLREFSQRRAAIDGREDELVSEFISGHGRRPSPVEQRRLAQQANLETRPDKQHRSLSEMTVEWRQRAAPFVGDDPVAWVSTLRNRNDLPLLRADDLADEMLGEVAQLAADRVAERHATFSRANVLAEVHRQLHGVRFASPDHRVMVAERTTDMALGEAVQVTAPELHHVPDRYRRADGTSRLHPADHRLYTTEALLDTEQRLLDLGRRTGGPTVAVGTVAAVADVNLPGRDYAMTLDQAVAVEKIATSGRRLDVLVGPAGTGKSTTMAGLRATWEAEHGAGSVIGLAPSAAAAEVVGDELGIDAENTAKWLYEHRRNRDRRETLAQVHHRLQAHPGSSKLREQADRLTTEIARWGLRAGQLLIVDEASLAGTFALDELAATSSEAGAKLLLVGDPYQLSAVEAGGMFRALVADRADVVPELADIRRFRSGWEKAASVELRVGDERAINAYETHGRVTGGDRDDLLDRLYHAWKTDVEAGKSSLMIAADAATVRELNQRARADRIATGAVTDTGLTVADGSTAGVGDLVVTRENNRLLTTGRSWVKNGDRWTVTATSEDGSMTVRRAGGAGEVVLPAAYVAEHVELAYATTAHRAQGRTVDTAHAMIAPTTSREVLYVAATRGRESNRLYVDTHYDPDPATGHDGTLEPQTAGQVLARVLANQGADLAAHDQIRASWDAAEGLVTLHAEYATLAQAAQADRWDSLLDRCGLTPHQTAVVRGSEAYGPLLAALRDAEARGLDIDTGLPALVASRSFAGAEDLASILHHRVDRWVARAGSRRQGAADLIAGLIPRAKGVTDPDMARALTERDQAMERRAITLAQQAVERGTGWIRRLGQPPTDPTQQAAWMAQVRVVAAYRDRWSITGPTPLDAQDQARTIEQVGHHKRAVVAAQRALAISRHDHHDPREPVEGVPSMTVEQKGVER